MTRTSAVCKTQFLAFYIKLAANVCSMLKLQHIRNF